MAPQSRCRTPLSLPRRSVHLRVSALANEYAKLHLMTKELSIALIDRVMICRGYSDHDNMILRNISYLVTLKINCISCVMFIIVDMVTDSPVVNYKC